MTSLVFNNFSRKTIIQLVKRCHILIVKGLEKGKFQYVNYITALCQGTEIMVTHHIPYYYLFYCHYFYFKILQIPARFFVLL